MSAWSFRGAYFPIAIVSVPFGVALLRLQRRLCPNPPVYCYYLSLSLFTVIISHYRSIFLPRRFPQCLYFEQEKPPAAISVGFHHCLLITYVMPHLSDHHRTTTCCCSQHSYLTLPTLSPRRNHCRPCHSIARALRQQPPHCLYPLPLLPFLCVNCQNSQ